MCASEQVPGWGRWRLGTNAESARGSEAKETLTSKVVWRGGVVVVILCSWELRMLRSPRLLLHLVLCHNVPFMEVGIWKRCVIWQADEDAGFRWRNEGGERQDCQIVGKVV